MTRVGDARRAAVVEQAMDVASSRGFEGLTFGSLADTTGVSKPALQALFGTKEALQLAVLSGAVQVWREKVLGPVEPLPEGREQLLAMLERWIDYLPTFSGGCPFIAGASELDGRPGPVRDALVVAVQRGQGLVRRQIALAIRLGELAPHTDADQLSYELHAALLKANHDRQLFGSRPSLEQARTAVGNAIARYER